MSQQLLRIIKKRYDLQFVSGVGMKMGQNEYMRESLQVRYALHVLIEDLDLSLDIAPGLCLDGNT